MEIRKENEFKFKNFIVKQDQCAMKVGTDGVLLGSWVPLIGAQKVLDVGTGTGLIALMLAQRSTALIDAVEIDNQAYFQAVSNFENSQWANRIKCYQSSFQAYSRGDVGYDLIVSNPPYFINAHKSDINARNVARHTNETLTFEELIDGVTKLLSSDGSFCVILPMKEGGIFIPMCEAKGLFCHKITRVKTKADKPEKRMLLAFGFLKKEVQSNVLVILNEEGDYSRPYIELTMDFYTHYPERTSW